MSIIARVARKVSEFETCHIDMLPTDVWLGPKEGDELDIFMEENFPRRTSNLVLMGMTVRFTLVDGIRVGISV